MAITLIATTSFAGASTPSAGINTSGATLLVCQFWSQDSGGTISDSKSNTWSYLTQRAGPFGSAGRIAYCVSPSSVGSGHTFQSANGTPAGVVYAFSGAAGPDSGKESARVNNGSDFVLPSNTGSALTPSQAGCLVLATVGGYPAGSSFTINGGFSTPDMVPSAGGTNYGVAASYLIQTSAASADPTWDEFPRTSAVTLQLVVFLPASGAGFIARPNRPINQAVNRAATY